MPFALSTGIDSAMLGAMQEYRSVLENSRVRSLIAIRKSLFPVTAGSLPAALLAAAVISVATRGATGIMTASAVAIPLLWVTGFVLFHRQQQKWLASQGEKPCRYDGNFLSDATAADEATQPLNAEATHPLSVATWAKRLNQNVLDPSELPAPGYVPAEDRMKVNLVPGWLIVAKGFDAIRDVYMSGEFAADGTPVWDLRTRLIKDIEEAAWKQGTMTDPGWHTRPR